MLFYFCLQVPYLKYQRQCLSGTHDFLSVYLDGSSPFKQLRYPNRTDEVWRLHSLFFVSLQESGQSPRLFFFFLFSLKVHSFQNKELTSQSCNSPGLLLISGSLIPFLVFYSFCAQKKPSFFPYFNIFGARILLDLKLLVLESQLDW